MIRHWRSEQTAHNRTLPVLRAAAFAGLIGLAGAACSNSAFESQPVEEQSSTSSTEPETSVETDDDTEPGDELALVADSPYEEPDLAAAGAEEEFSEIPAAEPVDEPAAADPDDTADATQVALGAGESAVCATVQIGRDAVSDGATERIAAQQELLVSRADLVEDGELVSLLETVDATAPLDAAVLDEALSRCEDLGYQP